MEKFVLIAPEAKSCKLYDEDFWCTLINQLQKIGYARKRERVILLPDYKYKKSA